MQDPKKESELPTGWLFIKIKEQNVRGLILARACFLIAHYELVALLDSDFELLSLLIEYLSTYFFLCDGNLFHKLS